MNEDVKKLGSVFKSKRKELSLSLKEVENATSIRTSHLEAIEEGKEEWFLSPVYMLGFMRQYAKFLELDGERLLQEHPAVLKMQGKKQEFSYGVGTLEKMGSSGGGAKRFPNLLWGALSLGILALAYYFAKYLNLF